MAYCKYGGRIVAELCSHDETMIRSIARVMRLTTKLRVEGWGTYANLASYMHNT